MSGKIIMIGSMKGGVSKTVTTFNLAYSLSKLGRKVLAVDFDSQANLSTCLGVEDVTAVPVTIGNLMMAQIEEEELPERNEYIQTRNGVDFISSSMVLSAVDAKLRLEMGAEKMLSDILEKLRGSYDYILIDTSPSLGALTINAMSAADGVMDIQIAYTEDQRGIGMYHEKMGIIEDAVGDKIAFSGSNNESATAMSINYETMDVFRSWGDPSEIERVEKIWEYEQKIDAKINRLVDLRAAINAAIESMENPEERLLLKYRYLKNESWEDISYDLNVSYRTVHRIHASALNNFVVPE